ncbi:diaminopimelate epimerase [Streptomyces sp. NPDC102274]|uniref:diaminopimelate epimerase n=1 Tax=Streptomyces sp. NPDC102274 TaxID=3366151 RepID=UPI003800B57F
MPHLSIAKTHGSRNDIFVIDGSPDDHFASADVPRAVQQLCDRRTGLGSDGVYFLADSGDGSGKAWFFNPDGSPALLCGNGMRCAGRLLLDRYDAESAVVHTGPYSFTVRRADDTAQGVRQVSVEMPPVDFTPADPVVAGVQWPFVGQVLPAFHATRTVSALAVPNSHLVSIVGAYDEAELVETGRRVADAPGSFPIGANVSFVLPLDDSEVFVHTFERGAGLTPSCGSGVAASRAVSSKLGLVDPDVRLRVRNPGGPARTWLQESGGRWQPVLEGNATVVYRTELDPADLLGGTPLEFTGETYLPEINAFTALFDDNLKALHAAGVNLTMI